jgi:hypothetical protein
MNSNNFQPGDVLRAKIRDRYNGFHPTIFLEGHSAQDFIGAMISHSKYNDVNVLMRESHFKSTLDLKFEDTYLVLGRFIKSKNEGRSGK